MKTVKVTNTKNKNHNILKINCFLSVMSHTYNIITTLYTVRAPKHQKQADGSVSQSETGCLHLKAYSQLLPSFIQESS